MPSAEFLFRSEEHPFGDNEEYAIVSLAMDLPEFFSTIAEHMKPAMFRHPEARHVIQAILDLYEKYHHVPPRSLIIDHVKRHLTTAHDWRPIVALLERRLDAREAPMIKDKITEWAKKKQFEMLYSEEALNALSKGQYDKISKIVEKANSISAAQHVGIWLAESLDTLFTKEAIERLTTGFSAIDQFLHGGGPARKEVLTWAAATGVGKTIVMVNCGAACAAKGYNVLHITLETSATEILRRYVGVVTKIPIVNIDMVAAKHSGQSVLPAIEDKEALLRERLARFHADKGSVLVSEFEADSISINHIKQFIDHLGKAKGWKPDVVIIDYMELMVPRSITRTDQDSKEYLRQKKIATEVRALAQSENVLLITATQGNRKSVMEPSEDGGKKERTEDTSNMGLSKLSNSYDKAMPMDYIISINQTKIEKTGVGGAEDVGKFRFYIEKNRHGPNNKWIHALVHYSTMAVTEQTSGTVQDV
jgi:replicative DNA helicase